ncbi:hypothetical protein BDC45DRAFT_443201, partial [Circinella umbellata]
IIRSQYLSDDTLLVQLQSSFNCRPSTSPWKKLQQSPIWQHRIDNLPSILSEYTRYKIPTVNQFKLGVDLIM